MHFVTPLTTEIMVNSQYIPWSNSSISLVCICVPLCALTLSWFSWVFSFSRVPLFPHRSDRHSC